VTPLNWIEIHYYNATREPIRRVNVRITGSGRVEVKSGTARRVSDSFAKDIAGDTVANYRERVYNVDANHVREVFQDLVNGVDWQIRFAQEAYDLQTLYIVFRVETPSAFGKLARNQDTPGIIVLNRSDCDTA
jgi:hypothetical protein